MIGSLLKHEWKGTYKTFLLMYAILFLISVTVFVGIRIDNSWLIAVALGILGFAIVPMGIVYCMMIFWRYYKNLYDNEGYLMHTLPVQGWQLLTSKIILALIWGIVTFVVGILCFIMIIFSIPTDVDINFKLWQGLRELTYQVGMENVLLFIGLCIFGTISTILEVYFLISASNLPFIRRGKVLVLLVFAYLLNQMESFILKLLAPNSLVELYDHLMHTEAASPLQFLDMFQAGGLYLLIMMILFSAIYFAGTSYLLSRQVSLK